jgi:ABC-type branched-subunit amino acid transport system ATPase component/ABC-type branched-subunit amino acid transport system permease subunit
MKTANDKAEAKPAARHFKPAQLALALAVLGIALFLAATLNNYYVFVLANVALLAIVGIGLNVLIGLSGQVSFGHVGFYAIGAYVVAILGAQLGFWIAWPLAGLVCAVVGAMLALPALRVKGPYLAMVTIAFGFIVEHAIIEADSLTGGQNGIMDVVAPAFGALLQGERAIAVIAIIATTAAFFACALVSRGNWGAAMRAVRDSEPAAESIGINPLTVKTVAFVVSALFAGLAGGLYAPLSGFVTPSSFGFIQSILFVLVVMIGGAGTLLGPLVGALIVGVLPELLARFEDVRLLIFGVLLLVVLWSAPNGVVGWFAGLWRRLAGAAAPPPVDAGDLAAGSKLEGRLRRSLKAHALSMRFGGVLAVNGLSLDVRPGAITSLIGPNGAGKSTVINMLGGFYTPTSGRVLIDEVELQGRRAFAVARAGIARSYQTSQLFGSLSALDNVCLALPRGRLGAIFSDTALRSKKAQARAAALLRWCSYGGPLHAAAGDLAHVDRRLVEIARALATDPEVILLDEPAAGLAREDKEALARLLRRIADAGIGVVLVEHDMPLVMDISDHVVVIDAGVFLASGVPAEVQDNPEVRKAYLGETATAVGASARRAAPERLAAGAPAALAVRALTAGYGAAPVLREVDVAVPAGATLALLGANGAGKTTLMRSLIGLQRPVEGSIRLDGEEISALPTEAIVARGLALVPEGRQVFPELSVLDNIRLGAFTSPAESERRVEAMLKRFPPLRERLHLRAGLLSGGEQQMLAIARALMANPRVLLLDEPSLGLAPKVIGELFEALQRLRDEGMTLVVVDQMAALALALADEACVFERGRVVVQGSAEEIAADPALAKAYLGGN